MRWHPHGLATLTRVPALMLCPAARYEAMMFCLSNLTYAYYFTEDDVYADKATAMLQTWFLNPDTRMNPHLQYAQVSYTSSARAAFSCTFAGALRQSNVVRLYVMEARDSRYRHRALLSIFPLPCCCVSAIQQIFDNTCAVYWIRVMLCSLCITNGAAITA